MTQFTHRPGTQATDHLPFTSARLLAYLDTLGIAHRTTDHPPVYTVQQARQLRPSLPGGHTKNLFLRDKKGSMWLVSTHADEEINLRGLARTLGARSLSFASRPRLEQCLGVIPGAVTPFAAINDRHSKVEIVLEQKLLNYDVLNFHPLDNARTTTLTPSDLIQFLESVRHTPRILEL